MTTREISLGYVPRAWQRECHERRKRFTVLALHRRAGKTYLAVAELVDSALRITLPEGRFFYVAPFLKQAKAIAWAMLKSFVAPLIAAGAVEVSEGELTLKFKHNGAVIRVYGADNPDAMRGVYLDGVVIDEVAQIDPEVWTEILRPTLADRRGWALFIGTPKGVNLFSELFFKGGTHPDWYSARYTVYDTNALPAQEVADLKEGMPINSFAREFLCDFSAAGDDQLISLNDVLSAEQRTYRKDQFEFAPRILGVDPARFGDDSSVIFPRQGLVAFPPLVYQGVDNMTFAARVAQKAIDWKADAIFCDAGNGAGVIDRLRQLEHDVIEVWFGGTPIDPQYKDKRTEMWCLGAEWLRQGGALPQGDMALRQDLAAPTYGFNPAGKRVLESKKDIKARGLPSPDRGDAWALTFAQPVKPRATKEQLFQMAYSDPTAPVEYDPYAQ